MGEFDVDAHLRRIHENPFRVVVDKITGSHLAVPIVQGGIDRLESKSTQAPNDSAQAVEAQEQPIVAESKADPLLPEDWLEIYADVLRIENLYGLGGAVYGFRFGPPCVGCHAKGDQFMQGAYVNVGRPKKCAICDQPLDKRTYSPVVQGTLSELIWPGVNIHRLALPEVTAPPQDDSTWEELRALRLEIAREEKLPAFCIFNDRTLKELAATMPETGSQMLQVHGIGQAKLEKYGPAFLHKINEIKSRA